MPQPRDSITCLERIADIGANREESILLDKNERVAPFPADFFQEFLNSLNSTTLTQYPDQSELYRRLADLYNLDTDQLLLVPGSDAGLKYIFETFSKESDEIVHLHPTYEMVRVYIAMFGCLPKAVGFSSNLNISIDTLVNALSYETKLAIIANPNQPTGTLLTLVEIEMLAKRADETDTLLVIDEAYIEFALETSAIGLTRRFQNLCVLRTFSKAYGLAGLRIGFLATSPKIKKHLSKIKSLHDINSVAIAASLFLLDRHKIVDSYVSEVHDSKKKLASSCLKINVDFIPSHANFSFVRLPKSVDTQSVVRSLAHHGFRVRLLSGTGTSLDGTLRFTVGPWQIMKSFLSALDRSIEESRCRPVGI